MRAGAFAEKRVIELLNRRFVPFYFNTGGPGLGLDPGAKTFVEGKTRNQWAFLAAFTPDGEYLGETDLYADKDQVFGFLRRLLRDHPEYAWTARREQELLAAADAGGASSEEHLAAAQLLEELGDYGQALTQYDAVRDPPASKKDGVQALLGILRILRYEKKWKEHELYETLLRDAGDEDVAGDVAMERGYRLLAGAKYLQARELLQAATREALRSPRLAELHFHAGVACWFLGDRDWAKFHWCWVVENRPEDRFYMRSYIAAAAEGMPYVNPELGGYKADVGNIGPQDIGREVKASLAVYHLLEPYYEQGELTKKRAPETPLSNDPEELVARLRDGNRFVEANNEVVDRLVEIGGPAIEPLMKAIEDERSLGRGYAAWALAQVLKTSEAEDGRALEVLKEAARDDDPYIRTLAASGLSDLERWR